MRVFCSLVLMMSLPAYATSQSTLSFNLDNDGIFGVDQDYTNGVFFSYTTPALSAEHQWFLSHGNNLTPSTDKLQISIAHKMWTPSDIGETLPQVNERPYAGLFQVDANYITLIDGKSVRYSLMLGTTGENAFSEQAQKLVHSITGSTEPEGWEYQVDSQFVGTLGYQQMDRLSYQELASQNGVELSHIFEANAGNFRSDIASGMMLRFGYNLKNSLGAAQINSENNFNPGMLGIERQGWFAFIGAKVRYRFNDITIEGERSNLPTPQNLYHVDLEHWQSEASVGATWYNAHRGISFALSMKSKEFEQTDSLISGNGSLSLFMFF